MHTLNALWRDFRTNHVSTPFEELIGFDKSLVRKNCKKERPYIDIIHYFVTDPRGTSRDEMIARTEKQKFKLEWFEVCEAAFEER